jgi:hypothetical protein
MDEVSIYCIVISACPTSVALSLAHCLVSLFLSSFSESTLDFLGQGWMEDNVEKGDAVDFSTVSLCTITSPSEIGVAGDEEYSEDEGN